jgi:sugar lactone lactonase YvrE
MHQFSVDSEGNLYIAEASGGRTQKFRPRPGADPAKLIGPPQPLMPMKPKATR